MIRRKRLQYQSRAEVQPLIPAQPVTADRWQPSLPARILRKIGLPAAILAGSLFFTQVPIVAEPVTVDRWQPRYVDQVRPKPSLPVAIQTASCFLPDITEYPLLEPGYWHRNYWTRGYWNPKYWQKYGAVETITVDRWQPQYPERIVGRAQPRQPDISFIYVPPAAEFITPDRWQPRYVDQVRPKPSIPRSIYSGSLFWADIPREETITLDKWQPTYPERLPRKPLLRQPDIPFIWVPPTAEIITADKWLGTYPDRILIKPTLSRAIRAGSFFYTRYELVIPPTYNLEIFLDVTTMEIKKFMIDVIARSFNVKAGDLLIETDGSAIYVVVKKPIIIRVS